VGGVPRAAAHGDGNQQTGAQTFGNVYTQLLEYIVSADLIFYVLMVGAVIVMRRKAPEIERPYRTFGYPLVPLIYIVIAGCSSSTWRYWRHRRRGSGIY
jgi:APA family basic amino acid/polyamine antiporter